MDVYIPTDEEADLLLREAGIESTPESRVAAKLVGGIVIRRLMKDLAERIAKKIDLTPASPSSET